MDKRKLFLALAALCTLGALAGVGYIVYMKGETSGSVAFIPALMAVLLFNASRPQDKQNKK